MQGRCLTSTDGARGCGSGKAWEGWVGLGGHWVLLRAKGVCWLSLQPQSRRGSAVQGWEKVGLGGADLEKGGAGRDL